MMRRVARTAGQTVGREHAHEADPVDLSRLLRARRERPRRRAAEQRDELAALHSITSSARSRIEVEISIPIALAVLKLTTSSNLVGCSIGRSVGFAPFAIRSRHGFQW